MEQSSGQVKPGYPLLEPGDFSFDVHDVKLYAPTEHLSKQPRDSVPASLLKLGREFVEVTNEESLKQQFLDTAKTVLHDHRLSNGEMVILNTVATIYERCDRLLRKRGDDTKFRETLIKNEATVRYVICDPIMEMFCEMEKLKVI